MRLRFPIAMVASGTRECPLTARGFEALRRDPNWRVQQVYFDAYQADRIDADSRVIHHLVRATGRSDYPYVRFGPITGNLLTTPWPTRLDALAALPRARCDAAGAEPPYHGEAPGAPLPCPA